MIRNQAGQYWTVYAYSAGLPVTGDALQITATLYVDGGGGALTDTNPDELGGGYYRFALEQAETDGAHLVLVAESSTPDVQVIGVPASVWPQEDWGATVALWGQHVVSNLVGLFSWGVHNYQAGQFGTPTFSGTLKGTAALRLYLVDWHVSEGGSTDPITFASHEVQHNLAPAVLVGQFDSLGWHAIDTLAARWEAEPAPGSWSPVATDGSGGDPMGTVSRAALFARLIEADGVENTMTAGTLALSLSSANQYGPWDGAWSLGPYVEGQDQCWVLGEQGSLYYWTGHTMTGVYGTLGLVRPSPSGSSPSLGGASLVLPAMQTRSYTAIPEPRRTVRVVRGDTVTLPLDLGRDVTGWSGVFACKRALADASYSIGPKALTWIDETQGTTSVTLDATDLADVAGHWAEVQITSGGSNVTALQFHLQVLADVVT